MRPQHSELLTPHPVIKGGEEDSFNILGFNCGPLSFVNGSVVFVDDGTASFKR
jgi:hypothetical protein